MTNVRPAARCDNTTISILMQHLDIAATDGEGNTIFFLRCTRMRAKAAA
jgi:hypothetical protein